MIPVQPLQRTDSHCLSINAALLVNYVHIQKVFPSTVAAQTKNGLRLAVVGKAVAVSLKAASPPRSRMSLQQITERPLLTPAAAHGLNSKRRFCPNCCTS